MLPKILDKSEVEHRIGYHPKCKYLGLTHLKFADDILVFMVKLGQLRGCFRKVCIHILLKNNLEKSYDLLCWKTR
ncbi:unnamed protein product [Brassica oleracea var. botrytis]